MFARSLPTMPSFSLGFEGDLKNCLFAILKGACSLCSATTLEGWAIPSANARPADLTKGRSFGAEAVAARAADVPAFAILLG